MELLPWGISVSIVEPGIIATPILEKPIAAVQEVVRNLPQQADDLYDTAISVGCKAA